MSRMSVGDGVQHFMNSRQNTQLKLRLNVLTQELASGKTQDVEKRLGGDRARFAGVDRSLTLLDGFALVANESSQALAMMQRTLGEVDDARVRLASQLVPVTTDSSPGQMAEAVTAARMTFDKIVQNMNVRLADRSLFAGVADNSNALAAPEGILTDLAAASAGATDAAGVIAAVDAWFDTPGGGFETAAYLGDTGAMISRRIDTNQSIVFAAKADDPALRAVFKAAAIAALAGELPGLPISEKASLLRRSGEQLMTSGQGLVDMQARLGAIESRIEDVKTAQTAQRSALSLLRNEMSSADPFDTASALQAVQLQLETHYALTARLSRLSLTEYLR